MRPPCREHRSASGFFEDFHTKEIRSARAKAVSSSSLAPRTRPDTTREIGLRARQQAVDARAPRDKSEKRRRVGDHSRDDDDDGHDVRDGPRDRVGHVAIVSVSWRLDGTDSPRLRHSSRSLSLFRSFTTRRLPAKLSLSPPSRPRYERR